MSIILIGFGEDIPMAVKTAALDALQTMFGITEDVKPLEFCVKPESTTPVSKENVIANT